MTNLDCSIGRFSKETRFSEKCAINLNRAWFELYTYIFMCKSTITYDLSDAIIGTENSKRQRSKIGVSIFQKFTSKIATPRSCIQSILSDQTNLYVRTVYFQWNFEENWVRFTADSCWFIVWKRIGCLCEVGWQHVCVSAVQTPSRKLIKKWSEWKASYISTAGAVKEWGKLPKQTKSNTSAEAPS